MIVGIFLSTLGVTQAGPAAQPLPVLDADGFQNLAATLMSRLDELEAKNYNLESKNHMLEAKNQKLESSLEELRRELVNHSVRDLPVLLISAWQSSGRTSSTESGETVTFESFLTNFNSGGGNGALDLDSGVFTCIIPGFYTVSYSAISYLKVSIDIGLTHIGINRMQLFKNNEDLVESVWGFATYGKPLDSQMAMTGTRTLVLE